MPGDLIAILGIGGLGHLAIQYARQMGFRTAAIGRGADKEGFARKLGAHEYIDADSGSPAVALQKLGGARIAIATAPDSKAISAFIDGLGPNGMLVVIGASPEPLSISPNQILGPRLAIQGSIWQSEIHSANCPQNTPTPNVEVIASGYATGYERNTLLTETAPDGFAADGRLVLPMPLF